MKEKEFDIMFAQRLLEAGYKYIGKDKGSLFATTSSGWEKTNGWWVLKETPQRMWNIQIDCFKFLTGREKELTKLSDIVKGE